MRWALWTARELALLLAYVHLLAHWWRLLWCAGCSAKSTLLLAILLRRLRSAFEVRETHNCGSRKIGREKWY